MPVENLVRTFTVLLIGCIYKLELPTAIPIDNEIIAQPDMVCLQDSMRIYFRTRNPFNGHVYIKGMFQTPGCHLDLTGDRQPPEAATLYEVPYRGCVLVSRERSVSPPGLSYTATVIVQFHHLFLTKVDRAYRLTCFYMETEKRVTVNIQVSMIPPAEIAVKPRMPTCSYEVVGGSLNGPVVRFAKVGDKVFHKWTCEEGVHGILIHSCIARDGSGTAYRLIDKTGCAVDPVALGDLTYSQSLTAAWTQVHVFKFADQMLVAFQCQITLCVKVEGGCQGITPPSCGPYGPPAPGSPPYAPARPLPPRPSPPYPSEQSQPLYAGPPAPPTGPLVHPPSYAANAPPASYTPHPPPDPPYTPQQALIYSSPPPLYTTRPQHETYTALPLGENYAVIGPPDSARPSQPLPPPHPPGPPPPLVTQPAREFFPIPIPRTFRPPYANYDGPSVPRRKSRSLNFLEQKVEQRMDEDMMEKNKDTATHTLDLHSQDLLVFNLDDTYPDQYISDPSVEEHSKGVQAEVCISKLSLTQTVVSIVLLFFSLLIVLAFCQRRYYLVRISNVKSAHSF